MIDGGDIGNVLVSIQNIPQIGSHNRNPVPANQAVHHTPSPPSTLSCQISPERSLPRRSSSEQSGRRQSRPGSWTGRNPTRRSPRGQAHSRFQTSIFLRNHARTLKFTKTFNFDAINFQKFLSWNYKHTLLNIFRPFLIKFVATISVLMRFWNFEKLDSGFPWAPGPGRDY